MEVTRDFKKLCAKVSKFFVKESVGSKKKELQISNLKWIALSAVVLFVTVVLFMPNESNVAFSHKVIEGSEEAHSIGKSDAPEPIPQATASDLWAAPAGRDSGTGSQVNYNTSMILGPKGGNANDQLRAGARLPVRILDKFTVSDQPVPILAELILNTKTGSGLNLPAGTRFYGEARFESGSERAKVDFNQLSLPSGEIRQISGIAAGKDGQMGIPGHVFSDGLKNTAGQLITSFIGSFAGGAMQTDVLGNSRGGVKNGLLNAVSQTAQTRAEMYGEKLKKQREWIEVPAGQEGDLILSKSLNLQEGGDNNE